MAGRATGLTAALVAAGVLAGPAAADAATIAVTGDDDALRALAPAPVLTRLDPNVVVALASDEGAYALAVAGPGPQPAMPDVRCTPTAGTHPVGFLGNGGYTVTLTVYARDDPTCARAPVAAFRGAYTVAAAARFVAPPPPVLLQRRAGSRGPLAHPVDLDPVRGADGYEVAVARADAAARSRGTPDVLVNAATLSGAMEFPAPGVYTASARAFALFGGRRVPTAASAPVTVRVVAPFDLAPATFPDRRGPRYALRARVRERSATGRVRVALAAGWSGRARWRSLGTVPIRRDASFSAGFSLRRGGRYRLRYAFAGSETVAAGVALERITVRRTTVR